MTNDEETRALRRLCERAGIEASEMREDPEHGLLLSPAVARKLCAMAPDPALGAQFALFIDQVSAFMRGRGDGKVH